jgi:mycoredoxin
MIQFHDGAVTADPIRAGGEPTIDEHGAPAGEGVFVYGADWCGDTRRSRALLDRLGIPFTDVDIDASPAANAWAAAQNDGQRRIPVVFLPGQAIVPMILIEPSDDDLLAALGRTGYLVPGTLPADETGSGSAFGEDAA